MATKPDPTVKGEDGPSQDRGPLLCSKRWILAYIGMLGFFFVYSLRVNMSVAIVCMVRDGNSTDNDTASGSSQCGGASNDSDTEDRGEFDWDKATKSMILSSFFYGYLVLQIPGGWFAGKFGGRRVLGTAILVTGAATVLVPEGARYDVRVLYALRVLMGVAEGVSFPSMHSMWGRWAPPAERTRLAAFTYSGLNLGNIFTYIGSGMLCAYGFDNGWASIFYITGGASLVWVLAWFYLVSDSPESHPTISPEERDYIVKAIHGKEQEGPREFKVPWLAILQSKANWACLVAHLANNWVHYTLLTGLPTFMKEVLHFDIKQNGVLSAVPYMAMMCTQLSVGHVADYMRRHWLSTATTRKIFQTISLLGCGSLVVTVGFISCEQRTLAVVVLALAVGLEGLCYAGYMVNHVDFAPKYGGVLFGINNLVATVPGIIAPIVTGALTPNKSQEEWRDVFYVCGAFSAVGALVYALLAQGELEPWDSTRGDDTELQVAKDGAKPHSGVDNMAFKAEKL